MVPFIAKWIFELLLGLSMGPLETYFVTFCTDRIPEFVGRTPEKKGTTG